MCTHRGATKCCGGTGDGVGVGDSERGDSNTGEVASGPASAWRTDKGVEGASQVMDKESPRVHDTSESRDDSMAVLPL